jgi:branched-chain amino acid transport system ATP-binding protein
VPERRNSADGKPGCFADLLALRLTHSGTELRRVHAPVAGAETEQWPIWIHEDERLDDLTDLHTDGRGRISGRPRRVGELLHLHGQPQLLEAILEALGGWVERHRKLGYCPLPLLEVENVSKHFGGIVALDGVSFDAEPGEIVGLIGPNGAGKTTAFNVITRLYTPDEGEVRFEDESLLRTPPSGVIRRGIARTFQNVELFRGMSVIDNVRVGAHARRGEQSAEDVLFYVNLYSLRHRPASALPYGTQKRVELARALISGPRLLLLDEPAGGLSHEEVSQLGTFSRQMRDDFDLTILLVEHHMGLVMGIADRVQVLDFGKMIAAGTPAEVRSNREVIEAYLGAPS